MLFDKIIQRFGKRLLLFFNCHVFSELADELSLLAEEVDVPLPVVPSSIPSPAFESYAVRCSRNSSLSISEVNSTGMLACSAIQLTVSGVLAIKPAAPTR